MLDDGIDVDDDVARLCLAREQKKVANDANCAVCLAFDEAHRLELLALQLVLEQKLGEGGNAGKRIVQLVRYAGDQLANSRELLGSPEVIGDLLLLGQISDADHQSDDIVAAVADVTQRHRSGELSTVLSPMNVLARPERLFE